MKRFSLDDVITTLAVKVKSRELAEEQAVQILDHLVKVGGGDISSLRLSAWTALTSKIDEVLPDIWSV